MQLIKEIAIKFKMSKILLTCFSNNENAMNFYTKKLGYHIDKSSPSRCVEGKKFKNKILLSNLVLIIFKLIFILFYRKEIL